MTGTIIILAIVIAEIAFALRYTLKHPDACEGCGSSCSCSGSCRTKNAAGKRSGRRNRGGNHTAEYMEDRSYRNQALESIWNETKTGTGKC